MELIGVLGGIIITNAPNLVGFILPPLVERLNKDVQNKEERYIVSFLVCIGAAILLHWPELANGKPDQFLASLSIIFVESNATYSLYFKNSNLRDYIQTRMGQGNEQPVSQ